MSTRMALDTGLPIDFEPVPKPTSSKQRNTRDWFRSRLGRLAQPAGRGAARPRNP